MDQTVPNTERGFKADEEMEIRILFDLLNEFFLHELQAALDDQGTERHVEWLRLGNKALSELVFIVNFQLIPWDQLGQLDPAVITREISTKWQEEAFERPQTRADTMLVSIHVENHGRLSGAYGREIAHFTAQSPLTSIEAQAVCTCLEGTSGLASKKFMPSVHAASD